MSDTISAVVNGVFYASITREKLNKLSSGNDLSSGAQSFDRRRQYEDYAHETVQPYDAGGNPRPEFYRLYPASAEKVFTKTEIERVKKQL